MLSRSLLVVAIAAFAVVQTAPGLNVDKLTDVAYSSLQTPPKDLPVQMQILIGEHLPPKERVRFALVSKHLKQFTDSKAIAKHLVAEYGTKAVQAAFDLGVDKIDVYDALLNTLGPHDGNYDYAAHMAARLGDTGKLNEWKQKYHRWPESIIVGSAEGGHLDLFGQAYKAKRPATETTRKALLAAAANGHDEFLRDLPQQFPNNMDAYLADEAVEAAAQYGLVGAVEAYREITTLIHVYSHALIGAARSGNLALTKKYCKIDPDQPADNAYAAAASGGHLSVMQYLDDHCAPYGFYRALAAAVANDQRDSFNYIRQRYPNELTGLAYAEAVRHDRQWYKEQLEPSADYSEHQDAIYAACEKRDPDTVQAMLDHFVETYQRPTMLPYLICQSIEVASQHGNWDVVERLIQLRTPSPLDVDRVVFAAVRDGRVNLVVKVLKSGLSGVQPNRWGGAFDFEQHPTLAMARAQLLILAKHPAFHALFSEKLTPATRLVFADALSGAIDIATKEDFTESQVDFLIDLADEFEQ